MWQWKQWQVEVLERWWQQRQQQQQQLQQWQRRQQQRSKQQSTQWLVEVLAMARMVATGHNNQPSLSFGLFFWHLKKLITQLRSADILGQGQTKTMPLCVDWGEVWDQHRVVATSMSDIYYVFTIIQMMWIGIWRHHHTATFQYLGEDYEKLADTLGQDWTETMPLCGWGFRPTQSGWHIHARHIYSSC